MSEILISKKRKKISLFVVVFALIAGIVLVQLLQAAGEFGDLESEFGNLEGPVSIIRDDTSASGGQYVQFQNAPSNEIQTVSFNPSNVTIMNPGRGFYTPLYRQPNSGFPNQTSFQSTRNDGFSVILVLVELNEFVSSNISTQVLDQYAQMYADARTAGVQLVVRHRYSAPASCDNGPPPEANLNQVLAHIGQLAPIMNENSDVILTLQAGFVGAWGEWHCSLNNLDSIANGTQIMNSLLSSLSSDITIQMRNPWRRAQLVGTTDYMPASEAFNGTNRSRLGFYNDCFLASPDDYGTYVDGGGMVLGSAEAWRAYVGAEGRYVPVGGETCPDAQGNDSTYGNCTNAQNELSRQKWTYLNRAYWEGMIQLWINNGCFDAINNKLGYRLQLTEARLNTVTTPGGTITFEFDIFNDGYAAPMKSHNVYLVLQNDSRTVTIPIQTEVRRWEGGTTSTVTATLNVPADTSPGTYNLALWLPSSQGNLASRPEYSIQLANQSVWDATSGYNRLNTSVVVQ